MDRRQFITGSLTGLSVGWPQSSEWRVTPREVDGYSGLDASVQLPALPADQNLNSVSPDWLITNFPQKTAIFRTSRKDEIAMSNGLIRRSWKLRPNAATVGFDNLMTGAAILRAVKPEAYVELNWQKLNVGGLQGQPDYAYLTPEWVERMTADPRAMVCTGFKIGKTQARFPWKRTRFSGNQPWPPSGARVTFRYELRDESMAGIRVFVHYEMYDGIPLLSKWLTVQNGSTSRVRLNRFTNEILAAVEYESAVNSGQWHTPTFMWRVTTNLEAQ